MKNKKCSKCKNYKELTLYNKSSQSPDGLQYWCKSCMSKRVNSFCNEKYKTNLVFRKTKAQQVTESRRKKPDLYKNLDLMRKYNISLLQFNEMLVSQNNNCKICKKEISNPNVDHCHVTGKVRGLLCKKCNTMLGYAEDNIQTLLGAVSYLKESM